MSESCSKVESTVKSSAERKRAGEALRTTRREALRSTSGASAQNTLVMNALIVLAVAVFALLAVPSPITAQGLCTGPDFTGDMKASAGGSLALSARTGAEAGAKLTLGENTSAEASGKITLGEKASASARAKLSLGDRPTVSAGAKLRLGENTTISANAKLRLDSREDVASETERVVSEKPKVEVLKITSGEDTVDLGEKAVPLGELREEHETGEKSRPGDAVDIRIEKHKPDITVHVGDEEYGGGKDLVKFGESIVVAEADTIDGDVVAIGGSVTVNGVIEGDCVSIGGTIDIGPHGVIEGDGVSVGGCINKAPGSVLKGDEVCTGGNIPTWLFRGGWPKTGLKFAGLAFAIGKALFMVFVAWLIILIARDRVRVTSRKVRSNMLASFGVGLLTMILVPIAMILLCITLIGIPVAILLPLALLIAGFFGYTAVGLALGQRLLGDESRGQSVVTAAVLGVLLIEGILVFGKILGLPGGVLWGLSIPIRIVGYAIAVCAFLIGLGATILSKLGQGPKVPPGEMVPPIPLVPETRMASPGAPGSGAVPPAPGAQAPGAPMPPTSPPSTKA